ncbi:hypothetical protein AAZX31_08G348800 [Glycine max]|uniref:Uncharacterized protein n=3 Tax=Glycine subgen. Soja TaxID=1462606 RepID=A0A0R0J328_SOYBN|nr:cyclin-dependent protein kinase inhibitor SMR12 [Glycine max]KAG5002373.1 hypothetical protein JHK87_023445 [Glycine soja]KAG5027645.1 hypothetical protein JHK86_023559 [Glycine max]KAG5138766.1 hypothetical protein JHK82_023497 [Glycine max]KAH1054716.1 hypothetical protein GYH30_023478 [Glycine max]KAH1239946.1 Cyclin-dependent protein kinase inhibitor SMR3 [Glycine max]|eukprot:XP_006586274.1 cyclin-dependent protein kinase inhibitor SMR12 [Glycine max]
MHFKTDHHTLFSSMSNQEFFLLTKDDDKEDLSNFEIVKRHTLTLSSSSNSQHSQKEEKKSNHQEIIEECQQQICRITKAHDSESSTSKLKEEDEEEDGFKTPTSLDHKIPLVPSQCPPAPRKTKPSLKRKTSYYNNHCNYCRHPLDLSKEVFELLFPTQHSNPLSGSHQSTKKVRSQEQK